VSSRPVKGFTLVELVVVMSILGILSMGAVYFITNSADGYASTQDRERLASRGRYALERMARAVRRALPGSARVSGDCLEFIPTLAGAYYLSLPVAAPGAQFKAIPPNVAGLDGARVAVAPTLAAYSLGVPGEVSSPVVVGPVDVDTEVSVTFDVPHQFVAESVRNRFYWVAEPVSYCVDGGDMWRYQNYGYNAVQPTTASLPNALPDRSLLAESVTASFNVIPVSLQRNAVVDIALVLQERDVEMDVAASIQVRNVP
jgi:MSHA biogenesis protein MshO